MTLPIVKTHHHNEISWDYNVDALVIGSGFAGLSAAIEANENKLDVLVIEKMNSFGGNSIISDGGIAAPNTYLQKQFNINDSEQLMYDDMLAAGLGLNHPDLVNTVVSHANQAFQWTIDTLGVPYLNRVDLFGGHSVPRCYTPEGITGATIILKMIDQIKARNISIRYRVAFQSFICNQQGHVIGAYVLEDYDYKTNHGNLKTIRATHGIVWQLVVLGLMFHLDHFKTRD
jgi:succinate dehydrogenase/fumarate reductase flavoprotein subunit